MTFGSKIFYVFTFLLVFLIMLIIGVTYGVSLSASVTRAVLAAVVFAFLTWVVVKVISIYVFPPEQIDDSDPENKTIGANLDLTVTDSNGNDQPETAPNASPPKLHDEFVPMSAKQINPEVSKIINSDPQKAAEIVRKMGFDEDD